MGNPLYWADIRVPAFLGRLLFRFGPIPSVLATPLTESRFGAFFRPVSYSCFPKKPKDT